MKRTASDPFNSSEKSAVLSLAAVVSLRMLGLFMVMPVLSVYALGLEGATVFTAGLAVGIYGLTQAGLQLPLGMLSDRIGRKPVIVGGLLMFLLGSVLAAWAQSIEWMIAARVLQGAGAVAAALSALAADLTRESQRTKAMAIIGASIGMAFTLSIVVGPALVSLIDVSGLFALAAGFAALGVLLIVLWTPVAPAPQARVSGFSTVLRNPQLLRLNFSVALLHLLVTAGFVVWPLYLTETLGIALSDHWWVYLSTVVFSLVLVAPLFRRVDGYPQPFKLILAAVILLALSAVLMALSNGLLMFWLGLFVFFMGFNFLEANMPALVSRIAPSEHKGGAMGLFTTAQFGGAFLGAIGGAWLYQNYGFMAVCFVAAAIAVVWAATILRGANEPLVSQLTPKNVTSNNGAE